MYGDIGMWLFSLMVLLLALLVSYYYPRFRGFMGEFWIQKELKKLPKGYSIFHNLLIFDQNTTYQIDHIVVSKYGIFVIEMKNYYGLITGGEYSSHWHQHLGKHVYSFMNPIHQNYGHIKALENVLHRSEKDFFSIVCFSNQAKLKVSCKNCFVTQTDFIRDIILKQQNTQIIEDDQIEEIISLLKNAAITDKKIKKEHIQNIRKKIRIQEELVQKNICPKCGSKLVTRNGRYGSFVACSNYPKCRYTK